MTTADRIAALQLTPRDDRPIDQVARVLSSILPGTVSDVLPLGGGSTSRTYALRHDDCDLIAKCNDDVAVIRNAVSTLTTLSELEIPVPRVVASTVASEIGGVVVMTRIPGHEMALDLPRMTRTQMTELAQVITAIQRAVATLPSGVACGFVGVGETPTRTWPDVVRHPSAAPVCDPLPEDCIDLVARLNAVIDLAEPHLAALTPVCFMDDITTKNVMTSNGTFTGIVDCDLVCHGDPLLHLGLTAASVHYQFPRECHFYVDELIRIRGLTPEDVATLRLYEAVFLLQFLTCAWSPQTGDWRSFAAALAEQCLNEAEDHFL